MNKDLKKILLYSGISISAFSAVAYSDENKSDYDMVEQLESDSIRSWLTENMNSGCFRVNNEEQYVDDQLITKEFIAKILKFTAKGKKDSLLSDPEFHEMLANMANNDKDSKAENAVKFKKWVFKWLETNGGMPNFEIDLGKEGLSLKFTKDK